MRIGIVNPYSWDVPGGVQYHVRDLAEELLRRGHHVEVLTPSTSDDLPEYATSVGAAIPIKFNGSVARLSFGPIVAAKTRKWLDEGAFDVVHIHEPIAPSISLLTLMNADEPMVGTFHSAMGRSHVRELAAKPARQWIERLAARIAVSAEARRTLVEHHGGDAIIIPNGVYTQRFAEAEPIPEWQGTPERPVIVFLGRLDEPRKGLPVFADAVPAVLERIPGARFLIAGRGEAEDIRRELEQYGDSVEFLGGITDEEKESLLRGASIYVAPQTGGESFGIVLVEAMAAGCAVVSSDIRAFSDVLEAGKVGYLFSNGNAADLADKLVDALADPEQLARTAAAGQRSANQYDWSVVTEQVLATYQTVISSEMADIPGPSSALGLIRSRMRSDQ